MKNPHPFSQWAIVLVSGLGQGALFGREALVRQPLELQRALNAARPGDIVTLKNGDWKDAVVSIEKGGLAGKPLEVRAEPNLAVLDA